MIATLTALITAHLVADFMLQTEWLVQRKWKPRFLLLHSTLVGVATAVAIGASTLQAGVAVAMVTLTHLVIDYLKVHKFTDTLWTFLADQAAHLLIITAVAFVCPQLAEHGWWGWLPGNFQAQLYAGMTILSGIILAVFVGGILIKKLVDRMPPPPQGAGMITGMAKGGLYIGWLERSLTMLLILTGKLDAVGFLLAAKSILRLGDITGTAQRHQAEYIIIGTFLSFGWALGVAMLTAKLITLWV